MNYVRARAPPLRPRRVRVRDVGVGDGQVGSSRLESAISAKALVESAIESR